MERFTNIATSYDSTWKASLGFSGQSKQLQGDKITNAPQKTLFGSFSIKCLPRSRSSSSCSTDSTTSTSSSEETSSISENIGSKFRAAIASKYGDSVAAAMDKQFSLSSTTQLSEKQISKIIKAVSCPTLPAKLNQNNWTTINKIIPSTDIVSTKGEILTAGSGLQSDYQSTMVPTAEILKSSYEADGIKGVCSRDYKNTNHSIRAC